MFLNIRPDPGEHQKCPDAGEHQSQTHNHKTIQYSHKTMYQPPILAEGSVHRSGKGTEALSSAYLNRSVAANDAFPSK